MSCLNIRPTGPTRPTSPPRPTRLLRILGLSFGLAVVIGGTIGVGILRTPGTVVARLGSEPLAVAVWVLGGVYSLLGAFALAELGTMTPEAGGYFAYARRAFGPAMAFAVGWCDLLVYCTALAYLSIAIGEFAGALAPAFASHAKAIAMVTLLGAALLQWGGLRISGLAQEIVSALKAVGFIGLAAACLISRAQSVPFIQPFAPTQPFPPLLALVLAFQLVIGTYGGWYAAIYFTEEDTEPARHLPRALIAGVLLLTAIYVAVNLALMAVLPIGQLATSSLPAADAAASVFGSRAARFITLLSILSLVGIIHPLMMMATRVLFAMARDRRASSALTSVSRRGTPEAALAAITAAALTLLATGTFDRLFAMVAVFMTGNYAAAMLSLIALRRREPDAPRPFRAWGYPWTVWIVLAVSVVYLGGAVAGDPMNSAAAAVLVAVSWPLWRFVR
jgi:APA family basic amino acid/polyamine antiporter